MAKSDVQPDNEEMKDLQPEDQDSTGKDSDDSNESSDDFVPEKSDKEYYKMWRESSAEAKKFRLELKALKSQIESQSKATQKEQGKYKDMYEESQSKLTKLEGVLSNASRQAAFRQEAIRQGCKPELVEVLEKTAALNEIELDEKFRANKDQVVFEVAQLREKYGAHFFQKEARAPKDGAPKKPTPSLTYEDWQKLPYDEKRKRWSEVKEE